MFLKSEGFASNLADPIGRCTLQQFCAQQALPYEGVPVSLETFTRYAVAFQQRLVPMVEDVSVTALDRQGNRFQLRLATGEEVTAKKVVVATGLSHAEYIPAELTQLPVELLSHSNNHHDLSKFKGREVVVIGSGQSALETAALLNEAQATVTLLVRRPLIEWHDAPAPPGPRSLWQRLRRPATPMGSGLKLWFCDAAPMAFYHLPKRIRVDMVKTYGQRGSPLELLGPAGSWWLKERVVGRVQILLDHNVRGAVAKGDKVVLRVDGPNGTPRQLTADHVIAATGYRFNVGSLPFLDRKLISELRCVQEAPRLSPSFESSIPGLYFTGIASAYNFGPIMRFLCGTQYAAERISSAIAHEQRHSPSSISVETASTRNRTAC
jgi:thioredoxin reductase